MNDRPWKSSLWLTAVFLAATVILYLVLPRGPFLASLPLLFFAAWLAIVLHDRRGERQVHRGLAAMGFRQVPAPSQAELAGIPHANDGEYGIKGLWVRQHGRIRIRIYRSTRVTRAFQGTHAWNRHTLCLLLDGPALQLGEFTLHSRLDPAIEGILARLARPHAGEPREESKTGIRTIDDHYHLHGHPDRSRAFGPAMVGVLHAAPWLELSSEHGAVLVTSTRPGFGGLSPHAFLDLAQSGLALAVELDPLAG